MKNVLVGMLICITAFVSRSQNLDSIVNYLEQGNEMAVQISDDPTTGFQRIAVYRKITHDTRLDIINVDVEVHLYNNGLPVNSKTVSNRYNVPLNTNRYSYIDSTGAEVPDTTAGAFQEYYYLVNRVVNEGVLFQLIKQNVLLSDAEGKFD